MKTYWVLVGSFGSGKSELALNLALEKAKEGPCTLVDLDVINPYFRTSERGDVLKPAGVELIMPPFALDKIEIMSLSAQVFSVFSPGEGNVIFDIGGDDVGSIALGQYRARFDQISPDRMNVLFIVNCLRPTAADFDSAMDVLAKIQYVSRLKVTGIVNNANLAGETEVCHLAEGYKLAKRLSEATGIPVWGSCGTREVLNSFKLYVKEQGLDPTYVGRYQAIEVMMHRSWDKFLKEGL